MSNVHSIITLQRAMETLGLDRTRLLEEARAVEAKLLLPLPLGATLQVIDRFSLRETPGIHPFGTAKIQARGNLDYFVPSSALLTDLERFPNVACDRVTHVASRLEGQAKVSLRTVAELVNDSKLASKELKAALDVVYRLLPLGLRLPEGSNASIDVAQACLLTDDVERIQEQISGNYPPGIEDFGAFCPSSWTTAVIRDLNTAYNLFRLRSSADPMDSQHRKRVFEWLDKTWNHKKCLPVSPEVVKAAEAVVLETNSRISVGNLSLREEVKGRHAKGAPETLMLIEQLAEDKAHAKGGSVQLQGVNFAFNSSKALRLSLMQAGVVTHDYRRLINFALKESN